MKTLEVIRNVLLSMFLLTLFLASPTPVPAQDCLYEEEADEFEGYEDCYICYTLDCDNYVCSNGIGSICYN